MKNLFTPHRLITALFATLFTLTFHTIGNAQTHIHVDAVNGINAATGRGAAGNAYKSITFALLISERNNLPDPWHVHIHPGTYDADPAKPANEREVFPLKLRSKMLFQGTTTAEDCILDAQHLGETKTSILRGEDVGDISIRNLTIQNMQASEGAGGITLLNEHGATNSIEACVIHNNAKNGVSTNTPLVLIGNTFSSNSEEAAETETNIIVTNNIFKDNYGGVAIYPPEGAAIEIDISGNTFDSADGIAFYVWSSPVTGNIIGNKFSNAWQGFKIDAGSLTGNVSHNTFNNNRGGGFSVSQRLTGNVTHNTFTENGADWSDNTGGFHVRAMEGNVTHNTFEKNTSRGGVAGFLVEIRFRGEITHNRFESNSVSGRVSTHHPRGIAVNVGWGYDYMMPEANVRIANNIFSNNAGSDELTYVVYTDGPAIYTNNLFTIIDGLSEGVSVPAVGMFFEPNRDRESNPNPNNVGIHNNIFSGMQTAIYTEIPDLPITHNLFHNIGLDFVNQEGSGVGNDVEFWELLAEGASNNIVGGLLLVDAANGDFHPVAGSPTIDAGTREYAPTDDFDGTARPVGAGVDIGPYEYKQIVDQTATFLPEDVNQDGRVSIADVIEVAQSLGKPVSEKPRADVNGDGNISFADLVAIARAIAKARSDAAAAPSHQETVLDAVTVQTWLELARIEDDGSLMFREGIANLERLLASLTPKETVLLANYPNPFNPETWIPYQLAQPADVTLRIHAVDSTLVRTLSLGHKAIGTYQSRNRAAYWDGKNEIGEPVASGVYFYTLSTESTRDSVTTGEFSATRKMLIRK